MCILYVYVYVNDTRFVTKMHVYVKHKILIHGFWSSVLGVLRVNRLLTKRFGQFVFRKIDSTKYQTSLFGSGMRVLHVCTSVCHWHRTPVDRDDVWLYIDM